MAGGTFLADDGGVAAVAATDGLDVRVLLTGGGLDDDWLVDGKCSICCLLGFDSCSASSNPIPSKRKIKTS